MENQISKEYKLLLNKYVGLPLTCETNNSFDMELLTLFEKFKLSDLQWFTIIVNDSIEVIPARNIDKYALIGILYSK